MSDRLSREHLESDALVSGYARAYAFYQQNKNALIFGTLAVLILIGGGIWYYLETIGQEDEAQQLLSQAEEQFQQGEYELALTGAEGESGGFAEIVTNYSRTNAANIASYYAAVSENRLGNYEEALNYIERFNPPDGILGVGAISLHGAILANLERYDEAANKYVEAAEWDDNEVTTPQNLLNAAEALYEGGDYSGSQELLTRIIDNYANTDYASDARRMEGMISAR